MAINATELRMIFNLIQQLRSKFGKIDVLSLGYPDLLITPMQLDRIFGAEVSEKMPIRSDSAQIAKDHSSEILAEGVFESIEIFKEMGTELTIMDNRSWNGKEILHDLNCQIPEAYTDRFHLIIDPGTLEHIFNIAQGVKNMCEMLKTGGYIYHQHPLCFINHGFYSISPTFYCDFYEQNGFAIRQLAHFTHKMDEHGFDVALGKLEPVKPMMHIRQPGTTSVIVEKVERRQITWPVQSIYAGRDRKNRRNDYKGSFACESITEEG